MEQIAATRNDIRQQFVFLANELNNRFPELDLRFNLKGNTSLVRYYAAAVSKDVHELDLAAASTQRLLYEAIFTIKELALLFDD